MKRPVLVLHLEDNPRDAELVRDQLQRAGFACELRVASDRAAYEAALARTSFDLILSDYRLPDYDGMAALALARATQPDVPFIIVSGKIGEDAAVAALKAGAHDYVMKDRLERLPAAVERELSEATMRREHERAEQQVRERVKELSALFRLSGLAERRDLPVEELYQEAANMLPLSWRYPEVACARIVIDDREFRTANFAESPWMQAAAVRVEGCVVGKLEIGYLVEKPAADEGPFLKEESDLLQAIAERLGHITARKRAEDALLLQARWAEALLKLLQRPASSETELVAHAVETLVALTESKLCFIGCVDSEETTMAGHVWSQHAMQECAVGGGKPVQFDVAHGGLWTAPIRQHQAIIVDDYAAAHPLKKGYPAGHVPLTRFLGVPVIREGRAVLVAGLANKVEEYSEADASETLIFLEGLWGVLNRKRAEEALHLKNLVFDASIAAISIADVTGAIAEANDAFVRMWAYPGRDEIVGKPLPQFFNDPNEAVAVLAALNGTGRWEGVFSAVRSDGSLFAAHGLATTLRDPQGSIVGYQSAVLDITERKRAEKELAHLHQHNALILNSAGEGILGLDLQGHHTFVNPAAATMLGYEIEELLGQPSHSTWHHTRADGSHYPSEACEIRAAATDGTVHRASTEVFWRKDGTSFPVEFASTPIRREGELAGAVVTFTDITERKRAEVQHAKLEAQLRQSQKMEAVGSLAGGVAHDFNNILTVITASCSFLEDGLHASDPLLEDVRTINDAAQSAAQLTRQLLAFGRRQVLEPRPLVLNALVAGAEKMLSRLIGEDVAIRVEPAPALGFAFVDPGQIEQVIINLAVNARDAMPLGGTLTIATANVELDEAFVGLHAGSSAGPFVRLAVTDTGTGMDAATQARVFEPFFTTKEVGKGTGLGLATVYGIVKQSGGFIALDSAPGRGTTFEIYLPRVEAAGQAWQTPSEASASKGRGETILLVEDDDQLRAAATRILTKLGYRVFGAAGIDDARRIAATEGPIHLLLTDVVMPGGSGRDVSLAVAAAHPAAKVLYMSGFTDDVIVKRGVLDPGVAFLLKPFTPDSLGRKVREVLEG